MFVPKAKSKSHSKTGRKNKEFLKKSIKLTRTEKNILIEEEVIDMEFLSPQSKHPQTGAMSINKKVFKKSGKGKYSIIDSEINSSGNMNHK
jgi:hypothetical protein